MDIHCKISSSISNFKEKIERKYGHERIYFGMYNIADYLKWLWYRYPIFWMGSDILNLRFPWSFLLKKATHYCENEAEQIMLSKHNISSKVHPLFFENPDDFDITYTQSDNPRVFLTCHPNREEEYGLNIVNKIAPRLPEITFHIYGISEHKCEDSPENIVYHGIIPDSLFNKQISKMQAGLRLNKFDGFSEVLAKSVLYGQYPISAIAYPYINSFITEEDLIKLLLGLKYKVQPNYEAREYWHKKLCELPIV